MMLKDLVQSILNGMEEPFKIYPEWMYEIQVDSEQGPPNGQSGRITQWRKMHSLAISILNVIKNYDVDYIDAYSAIRMLNSLISGGSIVHCLNREEDWIPDDDRSETKVKYWHHKNCSSLYRLKAANSEPQYVDYQRFSLSPATDKDEPLLNSLPNVGSIFAVLDEIFPVRFPYCYDDQCVVANAHSIGYDKDAPWHIIINRIKMGESILDVIIDFVWNPNKAEFELADVKFPEDFEDDENKS